jgi:hypothetical protein
MILAENISISMDQIASLGLGAVVTLLVFFIKDRVKSSQDNEKSIKEDISLIREALGVIKSEQKTMWKNVDEIKGDLKDIVHDLEEVKRADR